MTINELLVDYKKALFEEDTSTNILHSAQATYEQNQLIRHTKATKIINYMKAQFENYLLDHSEKQFKMSEISFYDGNLQIIIGEPLEPDMHDAMFGPTPEDITEQFKDFADKYKPLIIQIKKYD